MSNFIFLQPENQMMALYLTQAEDYVWSDPKSSLVKSRMFVELLIYELYKLFNLQIPTIYNGKKEENIYSLINDTAFKKNINSIVWSKIDFIRRISNRGAHHKKSVKESDQINVLKECYDVAQWFVGTFGLNHDIEFKEFTPPKNNYQEHIDYKKTINELNELIENLQTPHQNEIKTFLNQDTISSKFRDKNNSISNILKLNLDNITSKYNLNDMYEDELTSDQKDFVEQVSNFLNDDDHQVFILKGYAGTGKTYMTKGLVEYLALIGRTYTLAAPTGKASKVLRDKTKVEVSTIHKAIYSYKDLKEYMIKDEDGTETFKFYYELNKNENPINSVYIFDEASMISNVYSEGEFFRFGSGQLLKDIVEYVNFGINTKNKIIFIGDSAQLPPINMNDSPALSIDVLHNEFGLNSTGILLKEVKRQDTDSMILSNATYLRTAIEKNTFNQLQLQEEQKSFVKISHETIISKYLDSCNYAINGESIIIAYSNNVVDNYNKLIRNHFFPNELYLSKDDKIMAVANKSTPNGKMVFNGDFGLVRRVHPQDKNDFRWVFVKEVIKKDEEKNIQRQEINYHIPLSFRRVEIGFRSEDNKAYFEEYIVFENVLYRELIYNDKGVNFNYEDKKIESLEAKALYVDFKNRHPKLNANSNDFKQAIKNDPYFNSLKIKFGYALTCHKAQGSEWNNVFVDFEIPQGKLNKSYFRWAYTATTRASKCVYGINTPNIPILVDPTDEGDEGFRTYLQTKIENSLQNTNISITQILDRPWSVLYSFSNGTLAGRLTIHFNKRLEISSIVLIDNNLLGQEVMLLLQRYLINKNLDTNYNFSEPFLEDFYNAIKNKLEGSNIEISKITSMQYKERYTFSFENQSCEIDFGYNGRKQFNQAMQYIKGERGIYDTVKRLISE